MTFSVVHRQADLELGLSNFPSPHTNHTYDYLISDLLNKVKLIQKIKVKY